MAFDHENHYLDERGFQRDKKTGHLVGIEQRPAVAAEHADFPKWVGPHIGHVHRHPATGHVSTPHFAEHHEGRDGEVTVLVIDAEDEERALAPPTAI